MLWRGSNPKDYANNDDAQQYDSRLRGPVRQIELDIDPETGMKNYIANEQGDWATSAAYVKYSLARSIHYGRLYAGGGRFSRGKEEDLCEALRCLGQGLHTLEDWGAHTNYCELALREMGYDGVFPHTGVDTMMNIQGRDVFPLVTGTFGMVDFFHSMLGEATDHFVQSEIEEMDNTLGNAQSGTESSTSQNALTSLLGKLPGTRDLVTEADDLKKRSDAQTYENQHPGDTSRGMYDGQSGGYYEQSRDSDTGGPGSGLPGVDIDPKKTMAQIYPILVFRDKVVRRISSIVEKIPGLESLIEKISETVTIFVFSLLAPYIRPIISAASKQLQTGSTSVIESSAEHQYEPWTDPHCTDPTHSLLSKDHFYNILNEPAGSVAAAILKFVVPRVLYAWQHADVPVERVLDDCVSCFHHPALRDMSHEGHRTMFETMEEWVRSRKDRGANLNDILGSESVKTGGNHTGHGQDHGHGHGHGGHSHGHGHSHSHGHSHGQSHGGGQSSSGLSSIPGLSNIPGFGGSSGQEPSSSSGRPWEQLSNIPGMSSLSSKFSGLIPGGLSGGDSNRELSDDSVNTDTAGAPAQSYDQYQAPPQQSYEQQQQQQHYPPQQQDAGFSVPPPAGYEQYGQQVPAGYQPPTQGAHAYDYYQGPPQGGYGYQRY